MFFSSSFDTVMSRIFKNSDSNITIAQALRVATQALQTHSLSPNIDSRLLLQKATHKTKEDVLTQMQHCLQPDQIDMFERLVLMRLRGAPIAYIVNHKEFYGLNFFVDQSVLIPRPETEALVSCVLNATKNIKSSNIKILDLGTGSGCILISIIHNLTQSAIGIGVDVSKAAIDIASYNATRLLQNKSANITFVHSEWNEYLNQSQQSFDVIVSNPPYVSHKDHALMSFETIYEPPIALFGDCYNQILDFKRILKPNGIFVVEFGYNQSQELLTLARQQGMQDVQIIHDEARNRCMMIRGSA